MTILSAGTAVPDFTLHSTPDQTVSLAEFRGHNVILAFYPADCYRYDGGADSLERTIEDLIQRL